MFLEALDEVRRPMQIELYDEAGLLHLRWNIHSCWPSEYTVMPELDDDTVGLASMTIEHEGWERDPSVGPPVTGT